MSSFSRSAQQWATFARSWFLIDARMQPPGKIASMCSVRLQGKHKPIYHALSDCGDHVVVINSRHIAFSGNKWEQKVYSSHTGYPGGFKQVTAAQLHHKDPKAVRPAETFPSPFCSILHKMRISYFVLEQCFSTFFEPRHTSCGTPALKKKKG
uniref:Large ribosomal subunit protein uL13m n=1 Tax=Oryzias sinensis TaxID=183150 RepID=A0A8C7Y6Y9_9TELE